MANPRKVQKLFDDALAAIKSGDLTAAKALADRVVKADEKNFSCWRLKAHVHVASGETALSEKAFAIAARLAPPGQERARIYGELGFLFLRTGAPEKAAEYFKESLKLEPGRADVIFRLAEAYRLNGDHDHALTEYDRAIAQAGKKPDLLMGKATCLRESGRTHEAIDCLNQLLASAPDNLRARITLAHCYGDLGAFDDAESQLLAAVGRDPNNAYLHYECALFYRDIGALDKAAPAFEKTLALEPKATTVYYNYARIKRFADGDAIIEKMQRRLDELSRENETPDCLQAKAELLFALGKVAEDRARYDEAFNYWREANLLKRRTFEYNISDDRNRVSAIKRIVDKTLIDRLRLPDVGRPTPIFIVGMPRAGSTLCEQILASHPDIEGLGELTLLPQLVSTLEKSTNTSYPELLTKLDAERLRDLQETYMARLGARLTKPYFTDKLPGNFWLVGLITALFPGAPVINARRHPIDTGLSCYKHLFAESQKFAYDLDEIREYIELHEDLMAYWRETSPGAVHDLSYENLIGSPKDTISSMLTFCKLPWRDECLEFYKTKRAVKSSSAAQIRSPLHGDAVGHWRHYERYLQSFAGPERR